MDFDQLSQGLFIALFLILGTAWVLLLIQALRKSEAAGIWASRILGLALVWNLGALAYRGYAAGHAPWANQYESATMVAFGVILLYFIFQRRHKVPALGIMVIPAAMLAIAAANLLPGEYKKMAPLMPALQNYWLKIHVSLMLLSYGSFATTFGLSLMYLIKDGAWTRRTTWIALPIAGAVAGMFFGYVHASAHSPLWLSFLDRLGLSAINGSNAKAYALLALAGTVLGAVTAALVSRLPGSLIGLMPDKDTLDELNYQSVSLGFPLLTLGVILGAFWGHLAWGRYWAWDPKETWAFISWLIFAFFLHMRIFAGWNGRRIAWIGLLGAGSIVFTYWGVNFLLTGLHAYAKSS
ncbi:MAG: c-type cytochrome biogenesis protein CcsB [candidate division FCPU426 bacterium]